MKRVYTDPRFPHHEIVNDGDNVFHIVVYGDPQDQFIASEDITREEVSEEFAQRQAAEYFDYLASSQAEDNWRQDFTGGGTALAEPQPGKQKLGIKHEPGEPFEAPIEQNVGLDDLIGGTELLTQNDVDKLVAAAREEQDPARREQLRKQALSAMQQLESLARQLARTMLG